MKIFFKESIAPFVDKFLFDFLSAYSKVYSTNNFLLRLIEQWKSALDNKTFVGAVLMDLSKAFNCIPLNVIIAKFHAYDFSKNHLQNVVEKLFTDPFLKNQNWIYLWINNLKFYTVCFYCMPV